MREKWRVAAESRVKNGNGRLPLGGRTWKEYFEDLYDIDTEDQVAVHMYAFDCI